MRGQHEIFPNRVIYPGHPNAIALLIMDAYPSLEAATARQEGASYKDALTNSNIPGAGGNVYMGLDVLRVLVEKGPAAAFAFGNESWSSCVGPSSGNQEKAFIAGQQQADEVRGLFFELAEDWYEPMRQAKLDSLSINVSTPQASHSGPARSRM